MSIYEKTHKITLGLAYVSVATTTTTGSFWSMGKAHHVAMVFLIGTVSAATTIEVIQATDTSGSGAKAISGKSISLGVPDSDSVKIIEVEASELDVAGAFMAIAAKATAAGAGAILGATVHRYPIRYGPSSLIT